MSPWCRTGAGRATRSRWPSISRRGECSRLPRTTAIGTTRRGPSRSFGSGAELQSAPGGPMKQERHGWPSPRLGKEMAVRVYGHYGPPLVVFPTSGGDENEYEGQGMIGALAHH